MDCNGVKQKSTGKRRKPLCGKRGHKLWHAQGSGWYCMPEKGDEIRLYIRTVKEKHAYVISSVHLAVDQPVEISVLSLGVASMGVPSTGASSISATRTQKKLSRNQGRGPGSLSVRDSTVKFIGAEARIQ